MRTVTVVVALVVATVVAGGASYASSSWGTQTSYYVDRRGDSYPAYTRAQMRNKQYICGPGTQVCSWRWWEIVQRETARYGTADGWKFGYGNTSRAGYAWQDNAQVCTAIPSATDPCTQTGFVLYP